MNQTNEIYNRGTEYRVRETNDYDSFIDIIGNRQTNPKHVDDIKRSMTEKQLIVPVLVNDRMEVIDGQHRISACRALGRPVYYIIIEGYGLDDVQRINADSVPWKAKDFLKSFIDKYNVGMDQYEQYVILDNFTSENDISLASAMLLSNLRKGKKEIETEFESGRFEFNAIETAQGIVNAARDFNQYNPTIWKQRGFLLVFASFFLNTRYDHQRMIRNLPRNFNVLGLMGNQESVRVQLLHIYNAIGTIAGRLFEDRIRSDWRDMINRGDNDENGLI